VEDIGQNAGFAAERHFFKRLEKLWQVRRFVAMWVLLLVLLSGGVIFQNQRLSGYYKQLQPVGGGTYTEGVLGSFTNANPLYATGRVDGAVARLVFAGLFYFDENNQLAGNLAEKYEVNARGTVYTVTLRNGLLWQDGRPLTAEDVAFTYRVIQNPDAKSPLAASWKDIDVKAVDDVTVTFTLPNALSAFPYSMINGIVPKHILADIPMPQLRTADFNTISPVGAGPFMLEIIEVSGATQAERRQTIALAPNERYHLGRPQLNRFVLRTFIDEKTLLDSFRDQELDGVAGLETIPEEFRETRDVQTYNVPLTSAVYTFFNTSQPILKDTAVRRALVRAIDTVAVTRSLNYPVISVRSPLLKDQIGYNPKLIQYSHNIKAANKLLDKSGWKRTGSGARQKDGKTLGFTLTSEDTSEYRQIADALREQWQALGIRVEVVLLSDSELQTTLGAHSYDALLYGVALGVDPDAFAYWHSTQADPRSLSRLNFSEYESSVADSALEAGRTRTDPALRAIKYEPFLKAWRDDAPALGLYQPRFLYITRGQVFGFSPNIYNSGLDRYKNVHNWQIRQEKANKETTE